MNLEEQHAYNVFNQDSLYRAHEKREKQIKFQATEYKAQKETLGDSEFFGSSGAMVTGHVASDEAKDRLVDAFAKQKAKKDAYSRRRMHVDEEDIVHINDRNAHFNKKMERHYGDHVAEIKQNLERGTAL